jgi:hypothetical protein
MIINKYPRVYTLTQKSQRVFTVYKILTFGLIDEEMKYLLSINLPTGVETDVTTILVAEPYNVFILDSAGNDITSTVTINVALSGGVYHVKIYNGGATLTGVKLKILY